MIYRLLIKVKPQKQMVYTSIIQRVERKERFRENSEGHSNLKAFSLSKLRTYMGK